ncbi:MAG TPA: hypothetical protein VME01_07390, partial [Solirubrobacteraceae bacterium]|nr:hypothetical protein [Solirubrobacteraceae bacterium]
CHTNLSDKIKLSLTLGVISSKKPPVNGGKPLFELQDIQTGQIGIETVNADYGGKSLETVGTVALKGSVPGGGTFASKGFAKPSFSGSWSCHGVVYAQS